MGSRATLGAHTSSDRAPIRLTRFAASLSAGGLLGIALLGLVETPGLPVLSLALLHQALSPPGPKRNAKLGLPMRLALSFVFAISTGGIAGYWVPEALVALGASPTQAIHGFLLAIAWVALPHLILLAMAIAWNPGGGPTRLATTALVVFALESILPTLPGSVPFTLLGHAGLANPGLTQLASAGGVPTVSALLAIAGQSLHELIARPSPPGSRRWPAAALIAYASASLVGLPLAEALAAKPLSSPLPADETVSFLALQPALARAERLRPSLQAMNAERLVRLSRAHSQNEAFIVWPENALLEDAGGSGEAIALVRDAADSLEHGLIAGVSRLVQGDASRDRNAALRGSVVVAHPFEGSVEILDKHRAVPLLEAESAHPVLRWLGGLIGAAGRSARVREAAPSEPLSDAGGAIVLLCFEALFPGLASDRRPAEATVILVLADDSWIENPVPRRQLARFARYRAIEGRLPLLRVAHGGLSVHIDRLGQPVETLAPDAPGALRLHTRASGGPSMPERLCLVAAAALPAGSFLILSAVTTRRAGAGARVRPSRSAPRVC